jgi:hypothetical protein
LDFGEHLLNVVPPPEVVAVRFHRNTLKTLFSRFNYQSKKESKLINELTSQNRKRRR